VLTDEGEQLLAVFERALGGALARSRARPATPPPPWLVWLVVVLCRQRERQRWLVTVHRRLVLEDCGRSGDVPFLPGWRFAYHGIGLLLEGPGNEQLDVDFHDAEATWIDAYFFAHRVETLDPKPAPEARLAAWLPTDAMIDAAVDQLRTWGVLTPPRGGNRFQLCAWLEQRSISIGADDFALADADADADADTHERYVAWLAALLSHDRKSASRVIEDVVRNVGATAEPWCLQLLDGPLDNAAAHAVRALLTMPADHGATVAPLLARLDPTTTHPFIAHAITSYLLARGHERERALATAIAFAEVEQVTGYGGNPYLDELAMLVLEHDPPRGLSLVRLALRSSTPAVVDHVTELLALLDQPWSRRELVAALGADGQPDVTNRRYIAAGLARSRDAETRRIAAQLTPAPPEPTEGIGFSFDEVVAKWVEEESAYADELAPLAARLRAVLPDVF
jgi:hypothetical protein